MDIFTHLTSGYLLKKNLIKQENKIYMIFFLLSSIAPDIDILWSYYNMSLHRTLTHSLVLSPIFALIISFIFYFFVRKKWVFSIKKIYLISFVWILAHIFLDSIVVWWVPLFYPFSDKYYSFNLYTYVLDPFFFLIFILILFFVILKKFFKLKINLEKFFMLNFLFIFIILLRFWENFYAWKISNFSEYIVIPYSQELKDLFFSNRYKVINKQENFYNIEYIDIFSGKIFWKEKVKIYSDKENICKNKMHKWFLFKQNNLIWDIRYTSKLTNSWNCFRWKKY